MMNMVPEFTRDNGRSEFDSAEGGAAVGGHPARAGPGIAGVGLTAVRETPAGAGLVRISGRETILCNGARIICNSSRGLV